MRIAVGDLLGERGRGAEGRDDLDASGLLILRGECGEDRLKVCGGGNVEFFGGLRMYGGRHCEYHDKKLGAEGRHSAGRERFTVP